MWQWATLVVVIVTVAGCGGTSTTEGSRPQAAASTAPEAPVTASTQPSTSEGTESTAGRGERVIGGGDESTQSTESDPDTDPVENAPDARIEPGQPDADANPLSPSLGDLIRDWDLVNRETYEADPDANERVATEAEQFSVQAATGGGVFRAVVTQTAVLGGSLDAGGQVIELVIIGDLQASRDTAAISTSLRFVLVNPDDVFDAMAVVSEAADATVADVMTVEIDGVVIAIQRLDGPEGRVSVVLAQGVDPILLESRAVVLSQLLIAPENN